MTILEWILNKWISIRGKELIRFMIGLLESPCECGIKPPDSISHGVSYKVRMEENRRPLKMLTDIPAGRRILRRLISSWEDNIGMDLQEIDISMRNWVYSPQNRIIGDLMDAALNLKVP